MTLRRIQPTAGLFEATGGATVSVTGLSVSTARRDLVVDNVTLDIRQGEVLGLIGESGSGKTTVAQALMGYARPGLEVVGGSILVAGRELAGLRPRVLQRMRGTEIAYVPQDTGNSLNPLLTIGSQLEEMRRRVLDVNQHHELASMLDLVGLPNSAEFYRRRPHQLSGGQQQRLLLAIAFLGKPKLVVLDEPTTALDIMTQHMVLRALVQLIEIASPAVLYVSHDVALVNQIADRVAVMYAGRVVEHGTRHAVVTRALHPYTKGLIGAVPRTDSAVLPLGIPGRIPTASDRPLGCRFAPRCDHRFDACVVDPELVQVQVQGLTSSVACHLLGNTTTRHRLAISGPLRESQQSARAVPGEIDPPPEPSVTPARSSRVAVEALTIRYGPRTVIAGLTVDFPRRGCTALVGESGSGKSSMARALSGLQPAVNGVLRLDHDELDLASSHRARRHLQKIQYFFQNPVGALNPRKTVEQTLRDALRVFNRGMAGGEADAQIDNVLDQVALPRQARGRYPAQLSGGECQRVGIARALVVRPEVLICDEVTSALDVSVQASIAQLLHGLCASGQITMLFVTHNIALVRSIADQVIVLRGGSVTESGPTDQVFESSKDPYTRLLIDRTPTLTGVRT